MLVKLGDVWVDPSKVSSLSPYKENIMQRNTRIVCSAEDLYTNGEIDEFAAIVNASLQTQSFGGEPDVEQKGDKDPA